MTTVFKFAGAKGPGRLFFRLAIVEAIIMAVLFVVQFHMALPEEDADWPLSIFALINLFAAGGIALFAGFIHEGETGVKRLLLATGGIFVIDAMLQIILPARTIDLQDWATLIAWTLSFIMLGAILTREKAPLLIQGLFLSGLIIQGLVIIGDLSVDDFLMPDIGVNLMDWTYVTGTAVSMIAYLLGFQLFASAKAKDQRSFEKIGLSLHKRAYKGVGRLLSIAVTDLEYTFWRWRHPDASFSNFYAGSIALRLAHGGSHRTLGRLRHFSDEIQAGDDFAERGRPHFEALRDIGITPQDVVVEYGCGSLRIGQHFIAYLEPGRYWGLDIVENFYEAGLALLGEPAMSRHPHLRVIGDNSLAEVQTARPDVIVSVAVLKHVPPEEIDIYLNRITGLMSPHTRLIIDFDAGINGQRSGAKNWTYNRDLLANRIAVIRPGAKLRPARSITRRKEFLIVDGFEE